MRRGCISLGEIKCDECGKPIPYPDRYLAVNEKGGVEDEETQRESLQVETDAELAEDAVCAWNLEDMDFDALTKAFSDLRMRLAA